LSLLPVIEELSLIISTKSVAMGVEVQAEIENKKLKKTCETPVILNV